MRRFDFIFNGENAWEHGLAVTTRPALPSPQKRGDFVDVAGKSGSLFVTDNTYEDITISVSMNFVRAPFYVGRQFREIKNWLSGSGTLIFSDDTEVYYKVKTIELSDGKRRGRIGVDMEADFTCEPFAYYESGSFPKSIADCLLNPYYECEPIYYIEGEGMCDLTVNGNTMTINVGQNCIVNTQLSLAYKQDGVYVLQSISGASYEDMRLKNGMNEISVSEGFNLSIVPNWRSL